MFCKVLRYASQHDSAVWKFRESTTITPNTIDMILFDWFVFFWWDCHIVLAYFIYIFHDHQFGRK